MDANMTARKKALTPKESTFARLYVETGNATEAYRQAYDHNGNDATACRGAHDVLHRQTVAAYVANLQAEHRERHKVTVDQLTDQLEKARQVAMDARNAAAAVQAIMGKAKLHGLLVDRTQIEERPYVSFKMVGPMA
ncbi:MAG: terminase [Proteobacteria bacterium]|nr:terminase [Pseudomonadota bacterium]